MTTSKTTSKCSSGSTISSSTTHSKGVKKKSISMHEGIAIWCDCCSCEAEPYWAELAEEMGIDLGSDYEE